MLNLMRLPTIASILCAALILNGCGPRETEEPAADTDPDEVERIDHGFERSIQDTLRIEGEPTPVTLTLFDGRESPILLYYPEDDFIVSESPSREGYGIHLIANFGGQRNDDASLRFFFPSTGSYMNAPAQLEQLLTEQDGLADIEGYTLTPADGSAFCPGNHQEWRIDPRNNQVTGRACIGESNERFFLVINAYPPEYGDGFTPRSELIRNHVYWMDSGLPVMRPQ
jgi:hypothetical protein